MTRIVAPSRLHFGLFRVPGEEAVPAHERVYGGVGLMVELPGVIVSAAPAVSWHIEGMLASRAQEFALRYVSHLAGADRRPFQLLVERCPREHTGLGVGTQLGLAVAKALAVASGRFPTAVELAPVIGRGSRSAIGVHGFDRGGLVVECGKRVGEAVSPLSAHVMPPWSWRVLLFTPPVSDLWHGARERTAFANPAPGHTARLRRLAESVIVPAARNGDLTAFGAAVYEFNRCAGEPFALVQGGTYSSVVVSDLVTQLRKLGVRAVGQSSWGPTVFAITPDEDMAGWLARRFAGRVPVTVTRVSRGHRVEQD